MPQRQSRGSDGAGRILPSPTQRFEDLPDDGAGQPEEEPKTAALVQRKAD